MKFAEIVKNDSLKEAAAVKSEDQDWIRTRGIRVRAEGQQVDEKQWTLSMIVGGKEENFTEASVCGKSCCQIQWGSRNWGMDWSSYRRQEEKCYRGGCGSLWVCKRCLSPIAASLNATKIKWN